MLSGFELYPRWVPLEWEETEEDVKNYESFPQAKHIN